MNKMMRLATLVPLLAIGSALAQGNPMIYPKKGQTTDQMSKDRYECQAWAARESGFDPAQAQGETQRGGALRGGARGAAIGAIAGDAGKGAAVGAIAGGVRQGTQRRQQQQASQTGKANYDRAFKACLEGRDYAVE